LSKNKFKEPKITINRVYTRKGDKGNTTLIGGYKVSKNSLRVCAFGEIDELNVCVGYCTSLMNNPIFKEMRSKLVVIQHELFNLGNMIATKSNNYYKTMPKIDEKSIKNLEKNIEYYNKDLSVLDSFVLPGGDELNVRLHFARTICRRCERLIVQLYNEEKIDSIIITYLNRLSDLFFVMSRWSIYIRNKKEITWNPNYRG